MFILGKEKSSQVVQAISSLYYKKWISWYERTLAYSRHARYSKDPMKMLAFQYGMAKAETKLWAVVREGRRSIAKLEGKKEPNIDQIKKLKKQIEIHRLLIHISRTICDGVAWRTLRYNRMFISSSSRGRGAGPVEINTPDFKGEFSWAHYIVSKWPKSFALLNDLTQVLRIGDITEITDEGTPLIHEIKGNGKKIQNVFTSRKKQKLSKQEMRLFELQRIGIKREIKLPEGTVSHIQFMTPYFSNFKKVEKALRQAGRQAFTSCAIENFHTIEIINFSLVNAHTLEEIKSKSVPEQGKKLMVLSNWDSLFEDEVGNFLRVSVPYSIFPFSNHICMQLLSGNYQLMSKLDIEALQCFLIYHGWSIENPTEEDLDKQLLAFKNMRSEIFTKGKSLYEDSLNDIGLFTIKKGPFTMPFAISLYTRVIQEFMSGQTLLGVIEESYERARRSQHAYMYYPLFDESKIWR